MATSLPFRWIALLFHLREYALGLVVLTVCACGHLAIAFDLFFPTHVARLYRS
jgi:hypothetical protein